MNVDWYIYVAFVIFVVAMLLVDLKLFHAEGKDPTVRESATWVAVWISLAVAFGLILLGWKGSRASGEYFAGYLIEYSLSVDNMFVFILIFAYFSVPRAYQHQVLFYGILGAIVFRGLFIVLGTALIKNFEWIIYVFGAFLIYTAIRIALGKTDEIDPEGNPLLRWLRKRFPVTDEFHGQALVATVDARRVLTPLFVTLVFLEITDLLFAVDSIPAIFAITRSPFIVFTSNVFAILGLRAVYFLVAGAMDRLHLLNYGLAVILGFVGAKMLLEAAHVDIPIWLSLVVIVGVLAVTGVLSMIIPPQETPAATPD
ncbi:MAG: TerC family protein [Actinomycetota bacterium]